MTWREAAALAIPHAPVGSDNAACSVFAETITRSVYGGAACNAAPRGLWRLFTDPPCRDGWGAVSAVVRCGLADGPVVTGQPHADGRWWRVQGWHLVGDAARVTAGGLPESGGHSFTAWLDPHGGKGRLIDAAVHRGGRDVEVYANGWPGWFSQFGELRAVPLRVAP